MPSLRLAITMHSLHPTVCMNPSSFFRLYARTASHCVYAPLHSSVSVHPLRLTKIMQHFIPLSPCTRLTVSMHLSSSYLFILPPRFLCQYALTSIHCGYAPLSKLSLYLTPLHSSVSLHSLRVTVSISTPLQLIFSPSQKLHVIYPYQCPYEPHLTQHPD